ncbi:MAG: polysaccharide deacetylase family protein [Chitinophagaceae bacterium]|nr:polysaccharide deacetylase family protein [Chitinophagaceae bacterium]
MLKKLFSKRAIIFMYHRIVDPDIDPWGLAVSPVNFEQQLRVLASSYNTSYTKDIISQVHNRKLKRNCVALTFDDGYQDNFVSAKPLLERYNIPATFFIPTGNLDQEKLFWWDELMNIILRSTNLPNNFELSMEGEQLSFSINGEEQLTAELSAKHKNWSQPDQPPTKRSFLFKTLWQKMQCSPPQKIENLLYEIKNYVGVHFEQVNEIDTLMTTEQLMELSSDSLFDLGLHTFNHLDLSHYSADIQENEIVQNKKDLESIANKEINALAYPYGEYNSTTINIGKKLGLQAAFTVKQKPVSYLSNPFKLGRFQVRNWNGEQFEKHLRQWLKQS